MCVCIHNCVLVQIYTSYTELFMYYGIHTQFMQQTLYKSIQYMKPTISATHNYCWFEHINGYH